MPERQIRLPLHVLDLEAGELRSQAGEQVYLRPRSLAVLRLLAERAGAVVSKEDIFATVWDDAIVTEDSLTQCVVDIRRAIGDTERRVLRTVPRRGYVLQPPKPAETLESVKPVLAVLPFRSLKGAKASTLALGVAGEIFNELARNRDLRLIGRDSSFALGSQPANAQELGRQLGARYLVEGTAQRLKDEILVDVQLVDARDGTVAWGSHFRAKAAGVPELQQLIAAKIAANIRVGMHETEKHAVLNKAPRDLDVYELTLQAMIEHRFTREATIASRYYLDDALSRDPEYGLAWAQLAWVNLVDLWSRFTGEWDLSRLDEVMAQFSRAIDLDPRLARAYRGLGQAYLTKGEVDQAVTVSRVAYDIAPSEPDNLVCLGVALLQSGEFAEATRMVERALEFHPLRPSWYSFFYTIILWANERFDEALAEADACLLRAPTMFDMEVYRALALVGLGRLDEARAQIEEFKAKNLPLERLPYPPELASRFLEGLQAAGWKLSLARDRAAI